MNCNLDENQRKLGMRCRSFDCIPCKEHLSSKDRGIIDNEIIKMLQKEIEMLKLEVKHGCSICALQPDITIRELEGEIINLKSALNHCLPHVERLFQDIPDGLDPSFYHTLSYEGDMMEKEKIDSFKRLLK